MEIIVLVHAPPRTTLSVPEEGPVGFFVFESLYVDGWYQSAHHSATFPAMSNRPKGLSPAG